MRGTGGQGQRTQLSCFNISFYLENIFVILYAFPLPLIFTSCAATPSRSGSRRLCWRFMSASAEFILGAVHGHCSESCCCQWLPRGIYEPVMTVLRKPSERGADTAFVSLQGQAQACPLIIPGYLELPGCPCGFDGVGVLAACGCPMLGFSCGCLYSPRLLLEPGSIWKCRDHKESSHYIGHPGTGGLCTRHWPDGPHGRVEDLLRSS